MIVDLLARFEQERLLAYVRESASVVPWFIPRMPKTGALLRVTCMNFGLLGWVSDVNGYRYSPTHPEVDVPWLPIPDVLLGLWRAYVSNDPACAPECCLVNRYGRYGKLGMHVDADEGAQDVPVLSVSLGDAAVFRLGGLRREDPSETIVLRSGAVFVLGGEHRRCFHGVDRIDWGSSDLPGLAAGRMSFTLRRVTKVPSAMIRTLGGDT